MTRTEIIFAIVNIVAISLSPLIAVQVTQRLNKKKEAKARKIILFGNLMATRATTTTPLHVEALNRIDIEFYDKRNKYKKVMDAWKIYHDHLNDPTMKGNEDEFDWKTWNKKNPELLTDLLYEMSKSLGYDFNKVTIRRGHYFPKGLGDLEDEQTIIRRGFADIFLGRKAFPVLAFSPPPMGKQKETETNHKEIESGQNIGKGNPPK